MRPHANHSNGRYSSGEGYDAEFTTADFDADETACCGAHMTYHDSTLCCSCCWREVTG